MDTESRIAEAFNALANILCSYFSFDRQIMATALFKTGASGSREIVTEIDKEVEEICIKFLSSFFPSIPIFAEEHYKEGDILPESGWVFIVDPIDGTSEFARGGHEWSISLAAANNHIPQVGMILMPQHNFRFSACRGRGVLCNGEMVNPKDYTKGKKRIAVSPRQIQIPEFKLKIQKSGFIPLLVPTLTIKVISILDGKADAGVYFPQKDKSANIWDYAAALLLIEELGGRMTSLDGSAMPFGGQDIVHRNGWLACSSYCNHSELLKSLQ